MTRFAWVIRESHQGLFRTAGQAIPNPFEAIHSIALTNLIRSAISQSRAGTINKKADDLNTLLKRQSIHAGIIH